MLIERSKVAMVLAEVLGSAMLTYMVLAISRSGLGISYFIASAVAIAFGLMTLLLNNVVRGYFNPVITLGLWSIRKLRTVEAVIYIAAQFLGAVGASALFVYLTDQKLQSIAETSFNWRVLIAEAAGTFVFAFGVAAAMYRSYEGFKAAVAVGGSLFLGVMVAAAASNGLVNPAVAVGLQSWSKGYDLGPILGAVVGMNLYSLLYAPLVAPAEVAAASTGAKATQRVIAPVKKKPAKKATAKKR
jgi:glycerol uptake facilitator-like aquaporin